MVVKYLFISLLILLLGLLGALNPLRNGASWVLSPIQLGLKDMAISLKDSVLFFSRLADINDQNIALIKKQVALEVEILELKKVREENIFLREQLGIKEELLTDRKVMFARVMGNPTDLTGATIFLDKGSRHGVGNGDIVVSANYLVGRVTTPFPFKSLVTLITSPDTSITAFDIDVFGATEGLVVGRHGTSMEMLRILPGETVNVGDTIVTSGRDGLFIPGLSIGRVVSVTKVATEPLKSAFLEPLLDLNSLREVLVLKVL